MKKNARFSAQTIAFLRTASRQKNLEWLDKNREKFERLVLKPFQFLAASLKKELSSDAPGYHFPQKGIGRIKRPAHRIGEYGGPFREWLHYSASRPAESRFDRNPNLYFMIDSGDPDDPVLVAGGLYMPSSRQIRAIREAIAADASAFDQLFRSKEFSSRFKGGFSQEKKSSRPPRGFDPSHRRIEWLKLQAFFVWRPYTLKQFQSASFPELVARDFRQILRLNTLLEKALQGRLPRVERKRPQIDRFQELEITPRTMDF